MAKRFLVLNGPNLNLLGTREPEVYGSFTLAELEEYTSQRLATHSVQLEWKQSNHEGDLVQWIQDAASQNFAAVILNPGGYSHTSVAIHDAIKSVKIPVIEVHLSNVYRREGFRQTLLTAKASLGIMSGLGKDAYWLAVMSQL